MTRRIVVDCDVCLATDSEPADDATTLGLVLPELGAVTLDMCPVHRKEWIEPLVELARDYGVKGGAVALSQPPRHGGERVGRKAAGGRPFDCICCDADYAALTGLQAHYNNVHGTKGNFTQIYGPTCPLCGETTTRGHYQAVHEMSSTLAMMQARDNGDRYGVVRTLRARAQNVS